MPKVFFMEESYKTALTGLKKKIQILIQRCESFRAINAELAGRLEEAEKENELLTAKNKELKEKIDNLQMMEAFKVSAADVREARQNIGKLVKEIDRCIALLNNE